jgi:nitrogenase molybdenum-iron protein NifN
MLARLPTETVLIGDLEDLENGAGDSDLLITHSHGRQAAERLHIPFFRMGIPTFDRLGAGHLVSVGYRGTRDLIFTIGNLFAAETHEPGPDTWRHPHGATNHGDTASEADQLAVDAGGVETSWR